MSNIAAAPLLLESLDSQIRRHGGNGFNHQVFVTPVPGTYSFVYRFNTVDGEKQLQTRDECQVALIELDGGCQHVMVTGAGEYRLVTPWKAGGNRCLFSGHIGNSHEEAKRALQELYPRHHRWESLRAAPAVN